MDTNINATPTVTTSESKLASAVTGALAGLGCGLNTAAASFADEPYTARDGSGGGGSSSRKKRTKTTAAAYPGCDCEFKYRDYEWRKFTEFEPSRNGVDVREFFVVNLAGRELFTYAEGVVGHARVDQRFPHLSGEIVSAKKLASAGKLKEVYAWLQTPAVYDDESDDRPLHLQQRQEDCKSTTSVPLTVDRRSKVIVFRTHGESLFVQLMPTLRSEHKLVRGTPLFDKNNRGIRAAVGNMFSQHDYVVNCSPTEFCEIPVRKNKHGADRLQIVCLDRRGRFTAAAAGKKSLGSNVVSAFAGAIDVLGSATAAEETSFEDFTENEVIYNGVVNDKFQITDIFTKDKKNKPPKDTVTIVIDDEGVCVQYADDSADPPTTLFRWVNTDPGVSYSIMPRRFFNAKASVVAINESAGKRELKRYKSRERLI